MDRIEIPPLWLLLFLALAWGIGQWLPLPLFGVAGRWLGGALVAAGVALMGLAAAQMVLLRTTFIPRRDPSALVTGGIFRLSRNPIYLGDALVLTGAILWWDAPAALPLVPIFMALIQHRFIRGEEARLRAHFGDAFEAWAARTRRWL
ncbi:methyltransferase family protein [Acidimangrovimonas pyrenivorans]|uniref:Methyltransferase family protein n=1 Tax=Acidimangrovimonas pyrenivorans TaxID=2030798 RepID=A0ABV7AHM3_9RHOB